MIQTKSFSFVMTIILILSLIIGAETTAVQASSIKFDASAEEEIKSVIQSYFDVRYRAFSSMQLDGFGDLLATSSEAESFSRSELGKLKVQIRHAELEHLRYLKYQFFLDFKDISIDDVAQTATVSLTEGHDVVFEISEMVSTAEPIVSSMRNLEHVIVLSKNQNQWKIVSDYYDDYLWRMLRIANISTDGLLRSMDEPQIFIPESTEIQTLASCSLPNDESSHPYDRTGAVAYAHEWATAPRPYNNPPYDDFTNSPYAAS